MLKIIFFIFLFYIFNCRILTEENTKTNKIDQKKNLILVAITNYKWNNLVIFFKSYQKSNFENSDFVVFSHNQDEETIDKMKSFGAIIHPFPEELQNVNITESRWKIYSGFLKSNLDKYNMVFICNVIDTLFQKDIFQYYKNIKKSFIGMALEDAFLSREPINRDWIVKSYGEEYAKTLKNERVICISTIWGTADKIIEFSDKMYEVLSSEYSKQIYAVDQGVGNYLIYHDKMFKDCIIFSENRDGPVMTLGSAHPSFINFDSDKNILNTIGEVASVVYQYECHYDLRKNAVMKYCPELEKEFFGKPKSDVNITVFSILFFVGVLFLSFFLGLLYIYRYQITSLDGKGRNKCKLDLLIDFFR